MSSFRLERLLELAVREEEHCLNACQEAQARQAAIERQLQQLVETMADAACLGGLAGDEVGRFWAYRRALGDEIMVERGALRGAVAACEEARAQYVAARQRREMFDKLKARHVTKLRFEELRQEQGMLDDVGLRSFWQRALAT